MHKIKLLPTNKEEMRERGWQELDVVFVTADAYCDHPSFGVALLSRFLESRGYRVGVIAQPDWRKHDDFLKLGAPRLFFGVTAGNLDSMLNIYTPHLNLRKIDKYSPGGLSGLRPKLPTIVYANRLREIFPKAPLVIGGIEASLRRLSYYDFWSDKVRRPILFDAKADILVYGMGERPLLEIASRLAKGETVHEINDIRGTVIARPEFSFLENPVLLPSFQEVVSDKHKFIRAFNLYSRQLNPATARPVIQKTDSRFCIQLPPAEPLSEKEMDQLYDLPFSRRCHPSYDRFDGVPALKTVEASITSHRGCAASCSFCSLSLHQGRILVSRSIESLVHEAKKLIAEKDFKGIISDVGGPTANMYAAVCLIKNKCARQDCLWPGICRNFQIDYQKQIQMLEALRSLKGVRQVRIQSGVRYDLLLLPQAKKYFRMLCQYHVSGQLKIAPEHVSDRVLQLMHKPGFRAYEKFVWIYHSLNQELGKNQFLAQYFITAHPGCDPGDAKLLARFTKKMGYVPEQVQDFIPLPMTRSSCMYYTGLDPDTGKPLYVAKKGSERMLQRNMIQGSKKRPIPNPLARVPCLPSVGRGE
jgi:uncharacterized radical SAM protein YgiQ